MVGGVLRLDATTIFSQKSLSNTDQKTTPNCRFDPQLLSIPELTFPTAFFE